MADTDTLELRHIEAGMALLRADDVLTGKLFPDPALGIPDALTPPYVLVYGGIEILSSGGSTRLDGDACTWDTRWYAHCVALSLAGCAALAARVRTQLLNKVPTVDGRICNKIRKESNQPPAPDRSTPDPLYDWVDVYVMRSSPAGVILLADP